MQKLACLISKGTLYLCLSSLAWAQAGLAPVIPPTEGSPAHITDEQNRLMFGTLPHALENKAVANALYAQALLETANGSSEDALNKLRQVVALDPSYADAEVRLANMLLQTGRTNEALDQLKAATAANPDSAQIMAAYAYTEHLHGDREAALKLGMHALTLDPNEALASRTILEVASDQNDLSGGILKVEDILRAKKAGVKSGCWLALARIYVEVARSDRHTPSGETVLKTLLPIYQAAAAIPPPDVATLIALSDTYRDLGNKASALKTLDTAQKLEPANIDVVLRQADLKDAMARPEDALKDYRRAYAINPNQTGLRETLGRLCLSLKHFKEAAVMLQEAADRGPVDPGLSVDLGIAWQGAGDPVKAGSAFQRAFSSPECTPEAYLRLAIFQIEQKQFSQADKTLLAAQTQFPDSGKVRFYEAVENRYKKNYPAALACLAQVRELVAKTGTDKLDVNFYFESALTMNLANRKDLIEPTLREALDQFPGNADVMNELAFYWADAGQHLSEALAMATRARDIEPDSGAIEDTCGWIYFQMGHSQQALPYLQRAAVLTDNDPVVLQHLGDAYFKLGRNREAITAWRRALAKTPDNHDLTKRIGAAQAQANHAQSRSHP